MGFGRTNSCTPVKKTQEKTVSITENGSLEIVPDNGYDAMSKVIATVGVSSEPKQASGSVTVKLSSSSSFTCGTVDFTPVACGWSVDYNESFTKVVKGASYNVGGTSYGGGGFIASNLKNVFSAKTTLSGNTISGSISGARVAFTVTVNWWAVGV